VASLNSDIGSRLQEFAVLRTLAQGFGQGKLGRLPFLKFAVSPRLAGQQNRNPRARGRAAGKFPLLNRTVPVLDSGLPPPVHLAESGFPLVPLAQLIAGQGTRAVQARTGILQQLEEAVLSLGSRPRAKGVSDQFEARLRAKGVSDQFEARRPLG